MPQQSEREDTTTWTAPVKGEDAKNYYNSTVVDHTPSWKSRAGASCTRVEELLHYFTFSCRQTLVQVADAVGQSLFESWVIYFVQEWSKVFLSAMQEPTERQTLGHSVKI